MCSSLLTLVGSNPTDVLSSLAVLEVAALGLTPRTGALALDAALTTLIYVSLDVIEWSQPVSPVHPTPLLVWSLTGWTGGQPGALSLGFGAGALVGQTARFVRWGLWILEALDPFLLVGELIAVCAVLGLLGTLLHQRRAWLGGYADLVTFCQQRGASLAEVGSLVTLYVGFIFFDAFVTMAEDDALEAISYVFICLISLALLLLIAGVDVQYYYMISSISGGELTLRLLYTDCVNNLLCLLRIFFCWIRYLFYDLQAELVDFSFHYTELAEEELLGVAGFLEAGGHFSGGSLVGQLLSLGALVLVFF